MTLSQYGEAPGQSYGDDFWAAVTSLYDQAFPGLPAGIAAASSCGYRWPEVTTPFALFEGKRCVAHVGVISHPMILGGERVDVAGVHAVCTAIDRRRRGLCRQLLSCALAWADRNHSVAKLHTDDPPVYTGHGFEVVPTYRYRSRTQASGPVAKRLLEPATNPDDAALLAELLAARTPVSQLCSSTDDGWMVGIVAALSGRLHTGMWFLPEHDAIAVYDSDDDSNLLVEVIAHHLPDAATLRAAAPRPELPMLYSFCPDLLEPEATAERAPASIGSMMIRGDWPGPERFGISPLWEH